MYKVRIRFVKDGTAKYISHLDLMQVFRRAFMRIGLELAYSGGYHPHMQMNILLPLSTGFLRNVSFWIWSLPPTPARKTSSSA